MGTDIKVSTKVYNKDQYNTVVNREFKTFTGPVTPANLVTVDEFFRYYEELYIEIPIEGDINSHRYLIERSSELVNFEQSTEEIEPLLQEISQLREQLLLANQQILDLETQNTTIINGAV